MSFGLFSSPELVVENTQFNSPITEEEVKDACKGLPFQNDFPDELLEERKKDLSEKIKKMKQELRFLTSVYSDIEVLQRKSGHCQKWRQVFYARFKKIMNSKT